MSTFLVTLTVVVLSVVGAVAIAVQGQQQPATTRPAKKRDRAPATARPLPRHRRPLARRGRALPHTMKAVRPNLPAAIPVSTAAAPPSVLPSAPAPTRVSEPGAGGAPAGLTEGWATGRVGVSIWVRMRSGVVLTMVLALVGTLLAAGVAGIVVALALAVRSAVS